MAHKLACMVILARGDGTLAVAKVREATVNHRKRYTVEPTFGERCNMEYSSCRKAAYAAFNALWHTVQP